MCDQLGICEDKYSFYYQRFSLEVLLVNALIGRRTEIKEEDAIKIYWIQYSRLEEGGGGKAYDKKEERKK